MGEKITQLKLALRFRMHKMKKSHKFSIKIAALAVILLIFFALSFHSVYLAMDLNPDNTWHSTSVHTRILTILVFVFLTTAFRISKSWPVAAAVLIIIALQAQTITVNDLKGTAENRIFGVIVLDSVHLCGAEAAGPVFLPSGTITGEASILEHLGSLETTDGGCKVPKHLHYVRIPYLVFFHEIDKNHGYRTISRWFDRYIFNVEG